MSQEKKCVHQTEDVSEPVSTEEDTFGSSISFSVGENSVRIKEKPKTAAETENKPEADKWWLKRPETRMGSFDWKSVHAKGKASPSPSPDVSSSMKEFLEKERLCKALHKSEGEVKDKDDTLCDILASTAFDKYPSDFENATDEDIGSILEEMSKIAGALSPNTAPEHTKSGHSSKNPTEEEKSVEELLEEAEKLVQKNSGTISKSGSKSDTLLPESNVNQEPTESLARVRHLEAHIFEMIEAEVHKESEKIKRSPKNEKKRESSPSFEIVYENLKPAKTLELQRRRFEEQKVEISSSSDLDDPIERHSKSEEFRATKKVEPKDNLQKEITDVDKDFFDGILKRSKEKLEGGLSGSSSFGQEDFSHFLKLLQGQNDKEKPLENQDNASFLSVHKSQAQNNGEKSPAFPEKEIWEILEKEFPKVEPKKPVHEIVESDSSGRSGPTEKSSKSQGSCSGRSATDYSKKNISTQKYSKERKCLKQKVSEDKKVKDSNNELYEVGLTPRLELFADAIPKLIAEKSSENLKKQEQEEIEKVHKDKEKAQSDVRVLTQQSSMERNAKHPENISHKETPKDAEEAVNLILRKDSPHAQVSNNPTIKNSTFDKSKSNEQECRPINNLTMSLDNIKDIKPVEPLRKSTVVVPKKSPLSKSKLPPKPVSKFVTKVKLSPKPRKDSNVGLASVAFGSRVPMVKSTESLSKYSLAGGDTKRNLSKSDWEVLCREERHKNALLKEQIDSEAKLYKTQMESMRTAFEEELFALKKQNILLKAKVDEMSLNEKRPEVRNKNDVKLLSLERELNKQENLIQAYEVENKKLVQEVKCLQDQMKSMQKKQKAAPMQANESQQLLDRIKDLQEEALKTRLEVSALREKNTDYSMKNDDLIQQNSLLKEELEMFKEQLRTKNNYINDQLQMMTTAESELKKQVEDQRVELGSKTEQLRSTRFELEKLRQEVLPMEKELLDLKQKEVYMKEKLQVSKSHVEREKQLSLKLKDQVILDNKRILDLTRQVREMERILKRKNPDSVSALILAANSEHEKIGTEKVRLLEERITVLEGEIKIKEDSAQRMLLDFQKKFTEMKDRYDSQVLDLEGKLLEATEMKRKVFNDMFTQTANTHVESKGVETLKREEATKAASFDRDEKKEPKAVKVGPKSQNPKEDAHLIATIRGLKLELTNKEKTVSKLTKEFQELQKTNRRLQKEREKLLNERKSVRSLETDRNGKGPSDPKSITPKTTENDQNSNVYQNGHLPASNSQRLSASNQRLYDPLQYSESGETATTKRLVNENDILKEELNKVNRDFMALKNKRLHDLNLLQEEHEREMAALVKEYSIKFGDSKVGQINTQVAVISHLKEQIEKLRDYKEQVVVLRAEREHLENKVKSLTEKVKYLSSPGTEQLQLLQDKITILQQRHESREMTLQALVRDLLRNKTQCKNCKGETGKNKQLCYFRLELDHILGMLQEIANEH
ncbi:centrosomal protein of 162 kDa isoform X2 [Orussus abietinus]|uniref:centrosomal protein of 162 kDa isoform X2 n=1 Tax=Orussus abietinus TaxID=222816 RepID=UPI000625B9B5|nr:centrosomal protein of 162 kDa isoform X2 [Orussus abietinus]